MNDEFGRYTATLRTLARIYDVGNELAGQRLIYSMRLTRRLLPKDQRWRLPR